jgi:transposase
MTETNIGIDISKDHLDVHRLPGDERRRFDNSKAGHKALIRWIGDTPARVVYEPTGRYHRTLERALAAAGMPIAKVNPRQARRFAEATGNLAKTDALDAAMLTRMGAVLSLEARPVPSAIINDLRDLRTARNALIKDQVAALAGLAPIARQSGNWKGKSFIRGGRQQVRQGLYMPALVAIRFNADLKTKYEQLIKAGKAPKQAITAVMRKLIILANALLKKDRKWQTRVA